MALDISPGVHKTVSIALLLTFLAATWGIIFKPLINIDKKALNELDDAYFKINRSHRLIEELAHLSKDDLQNQQLMLKQLLVWTNAEANQESAMQAIIDKLMQSSGFSLKSLRIASTSVHGSLSRISVDVKGEGDEMALISLMASIEKNQPLLVIDQMAIQVLTTVPVTEQLPAVTSLLVEFRLSGFGALLQPVLVQQNTE